MKKFIMQIVNSSCVWKDNMLTWKMLIKMYILTAFDVVGGVQI